MNRRIGIVALALALVAGVLLGVRGCRRSPPAAPAVADASASSPREAGPPAARDAGVRDAAAAPPPSPFTVAKRYADQLRTCYSAKPSAEGRPWKAFGRAASTAGVDLSITARGELRGAKLWGSPGNARACLTAAIAGLPVGSGDQKTTTVRVPLRGLTQSRFPEGDVQLFMTGAYYEEELPSWDLAGGWTAICPRSGGAALVHVVVTVNQDTDTGGDLYWKVEARACPGDHVLLLKGAAVTGWLANGAPDAGPDDGGARPETPDAGEADGVSLRTLPLAGHEVDDVGVTLTMGTRRARLWAREEPDQLPLLILESGSTAELLLEEGQRYGLLWAGDLDRDGRDDFVVEQTDADDAWRIDLFLSSKTGGRLVRRAAGMWRLAD